MRGTCDAMREVRALVTGCAGFIGSHLTESLLADGITVVGVDCFNNNYARPHKLRNLERAQGWSNFDFVPIDLSRGELADVAERADVIFHLAAEPGVHQSWGTRFEAYVRNNVLATEHLLEAAVRSGSPRFVYASSSSIYGEAARFPTSEDVPPHPVSPYGATKLSGEHLCFAYEANFESTWWHCVTSRSTARGSAPTWPSRSSTPQSSKDVSSRYMGTANRLAISPLFRTSWPPRALPALPRALRAKF